MARKKGLSAFSANFEYQYAGPGDARAIAELFSDLTTLDTWRAKDDETYAYPGMTVTVYNDTSDNNGVYFLTSLPVTEASNWIKIGAGAGTIDYEDATNKPSINGIELSGNKTSEDLEIFSNVVILPDAFFTLTNEASELEIMQSLFDTTDYSIAAVRFEDLIRTISRTDTICARRVINEDGTTMVFPVSAVLGTSITTYDPAYTPHIEIIFDDYVFSNLRFDTKKVKKYVVQLYRYTGTYYLHKTELETENTSYSKLFTDSDVVENVLTVTHDMNTEKLIVSIYDSAKMVVMPTDVTIVDSNNVAIDLTGLPIMGVWNAVVFGSGGIAPPTPAAQSYLELTEKPKINGIEVVGSKSTIDYNIIIPDTTSDLINDSGFITTTTTVLDNFYNKTEVNEIVGNLNNIKYKTVTELPTTDISTSTIYLLLVSEGTYQQYMYIENVWEALGTTELDLSNYATIDDLNTKQDKETIYNTMEVNLVNNAIYNWDLTSNVSLVSAEGQGYIVATVGDTELLLTIPSGHTWAQEQSGILGANTVSEIMYRNGRWSKLVWSN